MYPLFTFNFSVLTVSRVLILVCLQLFALNINAAELIVNLTDEEQKQVVEKFKSELFERIYLAKRYKIAKVNVEPLLSLDKNISLILFADTELSLNSELDPHSVGRNSTWLGLLDSEHTRNTIDGLDLSAMNIPRGLSVTKEELIRGLFGVRLTINVWDIDLDTNEHVKSGVTDSPGEFRNIKLDAITSIKGTIDVKVLNKRFAISPVQSDPTFHIIVERDEDKVFSMSNDFPTEMDSKMSAENESRRQKYLEALKNQADFELDKISP